MFRKLGRMQSRGGRSADSVAATPSFASPMESDATEIKMENGVADKPGRGKKKKKDRGLNDDFDGLADSIDASGNFAGGGGGQGGGGFGGGFGFEKNAESLRELNESLYRRVAATKEWIENNYYEIAPERQSPDLVSMNQFCADYANHQDGIFLSPHFAEANKTFTSAMLALSVLDLPP